MFHTEDYSFPSGPWAVGRPEARELGPVRGPARHEVKRARAGPARTSCRAWAAPQARGPAREHEAHVAR